MRPARPQFVLFGSSIVEFSYGYSGWGSILSEIYSRKADICLRGYAGWNSRRGLEVLEQVFPKDEAVQPSLVIVYFGGNDSVAPHPSGLGPHVPLPEYIENMKKIATYLMKLSDKTRVIFLSAPPINEEQIGQRPSVNSEIFADPGRSNELCHQYSDACVALCKELNESNLKVIDLWNVLQQRHDWSTAYFRDGIHFNSAASKIVVAQILKVLQEADWEPSLHWKSMPTEFSEDSPYYPVARNGEKTINISEGTFHWETQWE